MNLAKSIAASGLRKQQLRMDTIANNVTNATTIGYKNARLDFKDSLYSAGITPGRVRSPENNIQKGHGVLVAGITRDFKPGILQRTERELDFAIEGEGFFSLLDPNRGTVYTRNGNFQLSAEPGGTFLVNGEGLYVLDENGDRIVTPFGANRVNVTEAGTIQFLRGSDIIGEVRPGIFTFRNLKGLETTGGGNFFPSPAAGERLAANVTLRQGMLEGSNVNLADEMARLIRTQRAFQLASRALTTADDMEGLANNMRR